MKTALLLAFAFLAPAASACTAEPPTTDDRQAAEQAQALEQAHAQVGMPAIGDFSEKRFMKDLYELRDKPIPTHAYISNEMQGCLIYLGNAVGYGLPYGTQYTAPTKLRETRIGSGYFHDQVPQAEPNGLFMPPSAEGTWVMMKNPTEDKVQPVYIEQRVLVSPFRMTKQECPERGTTTASLTPGK